jgi:hypothetical protein
MVAAIYIELSPWLLTELFLLPRAVIFSLIFQQLLLASFFRFFRPFQLLFLLLLLICLRLLLSLAVFSLFLFLCDSLLFVSGAFLVCLLFLVLFGGFGSLHLLLLSSGLFFFLGLSHCFGVSSIVTLPFDSENLVYIRTSVNTSSRSLKHGLQEQVRFFRFMTSYDFVWFYIELLTHNHLD